MKPCPRFRPGTRCYADAAVGPSFVPDRETGLRGDAPFLNPSHDLFLSVRNGAAGTVFSADLAILAELVHTNIDGWVMNKGKIDARYKELAYLSKGNPRPEITPTKLESLNRALIKASNGEVNRLEKLMNFLATTGGVTPFIGLFGTVWGIMNAFTELGIQKTAGLDAVAPGIAEALIATALGLFAAIPAVIFYNHYLQRIKTIIAEMEDFSLEFLNIAERLYGV